MDTLPACARFAFPLALSLGLGLLGPGLIRAGAEFGLFRKYWGDVIVNTDMTAAGRGLTPPTPEQPVYYLGRSLGAKLGSIPGDEMPPDREVNRFAAKILARQGYLGAVPGAHEPTLFLVMQWGYLTPRTGDLYWFLGYDPNKEVTLPAFRSREIETVQQNLVDDNYGIIVTAFDYQSAKTMRPIIYWQTRIALPAVGKTMTQALPTMLLAAGPAIGRESKSPVLRSADNERQGHVKLGELQILGVSPEPARDTGSDAKK